MRAYARGSVRTDGIFAVIAYTVFLAACADERKSVHFSGTTKSAL